MLQLLDRRVRLLRKSLEGTRARTAPLKETLQITLQLDEPGTIWCQGRSASMISFFQLHASQMPGVRRQKWWRPRLSCFLRKSLAKTFRPTPPLC